MCMLNAIIAYNKGMDIPCDNMFVVKENHEMARLVKPRENSNELFKISLTSHRIVIVIFTFHYC